MCFRQKHNQYGSRTFQEVHWAFAKVLYDEVPHPQGPGPFARGQDVRDGNLRRTRFLVLAELRHPLPPGDGQEPDGMAAWECVGDLSVDC